ncbi:hypothetical protein SAMN05443579_101696 [Variovorax sp. PDC80]|jgi:hypothetical protein|nr:hypothetical protein SAMN05443579_101696 [Variovorax sp. PDC80]
MTLKRLHQLLRVASHLLDQAADDAHKTRLQPLSDNIERIGRALIEVMEVQRQIHLVQPELRLRSLAAPARERDAILLFARCMAEAIELEERGETLAAIATYEWFMGNSRSLARRAIAKAQIRRLSSASEPTR